MIGSRKYVEAWKCKALGVQKGTFFGGRDASSPANHLQEMQTTKENELDEHAREL